MALVIAVLVMAACSGKGSRGGGSGEVAEVEVAGPATPAPVTGHPRLLVRASDVPRLRSWATSANPIYAGALRRQADLARRLMDEGEIPGSDTGQTTFEEHPSELYAALFGFLSLVEPDEAARHDAGRRARALLMHVIARAAPGPGKEDEPFRDPDFATYDRARWWGASFAYALDWAYPYFTTDDKALIRTVLLRWAQEQYRAYPLTELSGPVPSPDGPLNDPALLADPKSVKWSLNNYYIGRARNLGLLAMALDPADDPDGALRKHLQAAVGSWAYVTDHALRTLAQGGMSPEGLLYGPDAVGRLMELLWSVHTAGEDDPVGLGRQAVMADNPFYVQTVEALLQSLPQQPTRLGGDDESLGPVYQPAWFGDGQTYWLPGVLPSFAYLALHARERGDHKTYDAIRWLVTEAEPGGRDRLVDRVGRTNELMHTILGFVVLDPAMPPAADPRSDLPLSFVAPGLQRILARTCWCDDARLFTTAMTWKGIDHQRGDAGDFGFHRKGAWLTKMRLAYEDEFSDFHNAVTVENARPARAEKGDDRYEFWQRGSQWIHDAAGDPAGVTISVADGHVAISGDLTQLYNSTSEDALDVAHVSRTVVWLEPDHIVVYDRTESKVDGRSARFWLQLPGEPSIDGSRATVDVGRQQLASTTLLPQDAVLTGERSRDHATEDAAKGEPMTHRLRVQPANPGRSNRFLHVVQGADAGEPIDAPVLVTSAGATPFTGAVVAGVAVLFPVDAGPVERLDVAAPDGAREVVVTGLSPGAGYTVTSSDRRIIISPGGDVKADAGGVLTRPL